MITCTKDYATVLKECYESDSNLLSEWHVEAGNGLDRCVERTLEDFSKCGEDFKFFVIREEGELFGYFGTECIDGNSFLTGFFIMPKYRNDAGHNKFWSEVKNQIHNNFFVGIHDKNTPAKKFLEKSGGRVFTKVESGSFYLFLGE